MDLAAAKVVIARAVYAMDRPYTYLIPPELDGRVLPGVRVLVPFGNGNRRSDAMVIALAQVPEDGAERYKQIETVLDDAPVLDEKGIQLALWMRDQNFCTVYDAVKAMLPAGLYFSLQDHVCLAPGMDRETAYAAAGRSKSAGKLLDVIFANGGEAELKAIRVALGTASPAPALKALTDRGVLTLETSASRGVGDKTEQIAVLAVPPEEALAQVQQNRRRSPLRASVVELLASVGSASAKEVCYYTGASMTTLRSLKKSGLIDLERQEVSRYEPPEVPPAGPVTLNAEQEAAYRDLCALADRGEPAVSLLYGVTGSGKTLIYIKLIEKILSEGRDALVLVPEIALTPQLLNIFASHFGKQTAVLHSGLRAGERYDEWKRIRAGKARVVVGTRSAVFAPLANPGLIILDEEQEYSYKSENVPRYHARDVAKYRCVQNRCLLVLGSATPSLESRYQAQRGAYHMQVLTRRYRDRPLPDVMVADMKQELRAGNGSCVSSVLRRELEDNFSRGEQSILFLNRRGASRMVSCGECGYVPVCPRCEVHLTYHSANGRLMCHHCGYSEPFRSDCPECGGKFQLIGVGTQKLQTELETLFPGREILRMDTDTVSASRSHEKLLRHFREDRVPVLVGTQMVAKGLDFENVTLVGVVDADLALYVDDFRASERAFSLLTQVIGRAGRGGKRGRAVIQTYTPDHEVIRFAARQDYDSFYQQELELRDLRGFPPFCDIFTISASGLSEQRVADACLILRSTIDTALRSDPALAGDAMRLLGPAPDRVPKINDRYRYHLTLCGRNTKALRAMIAQVLRAVPKDKRFHEITVIADCNPFQ